MRDNCPAKEALFSLFVWLGKRPGDLAGEGVIYSLIVCTGKTHGRTFGTSMTDIANQLLHGLLVTFLNFCFHSQKRLIYWCRLIAKSSSLVEEHYQSWSFVLKTGITASPVLKLCVVECFVGSSSQ